MSNTKRYYWLRLHDDFFESLRIKKLRKMAGGDTYTIIYLKMQLKAIKSGGVLEFKGYEQDFADELALDLDESPDNVKVTLQYLLSCGLCECSDNVSFFFPYAVDNTGSETASTQRSRECRARQKVLHCNTDATQLQQMCNVEREIEKEKEIEIDNIGGDIYINNTNKEDIINMQNPKNTPPNHYGRFDNVVLSDKDYKALAKDYPGLYNQYIERLSCYMADKGKSYKNHYAVIVKWILTDEERNKQTDNGTRNSSFSIDDIEKTIREKAVTVSEKS